MPRVTAERSARPRTARAIVVEGLASRNALIPRVKIGESILVYWAFEQDWDCQPLRGIVRQRSRTGLHLDTGRGVVAVLGISVERGTVLRRARRRASA